MKKSVMVTMLAAQLFGAGVQAASLEPVETVQQRSGAFAGARLQMAFGGAEAGQAQAGLGIGPMRATRDGDGRIRAAFGDGLEFGIRAGAKPQLSIAGRSLKQIKLQADGKSGGVPTWVLITGGVVLAVGVVALVAVDAVADASTE